SISGAPPPPASSTAFGEQTVTRPWGLSLGKPRRREQAGPSGTCTCRRDRSPQDGEHPVMPGQMKTPGPDHPITIEPNAARVIVRVGDRVVADTTAALNLRESTYPAVPYIPLADVDQEVLRPTDTSTYCPYKGDAAYYSLTLPDGELADVIW